MRVNALSVKAKSLSGETTEGLECSECGQRFFDTMSDVTPRQILQSAITTFIDHADHEHHSVGGIIGLERRIAA